MRHDFTEVTKNTLAKRAGMRCSNPACGQSTSGPSDDAESAVNIGVAAHITAASPGGPRYDEAMTASSRRSLDNAIWLCQNCAKLVDADSSRYTVALIRKWKQDAEQCARTDIASPRTLLHSLVLEQRLDKCNEGDAMFLVALLQADAPIPRYALISVEFQTKDGRTGTWGSNTSIMIRSVHARASHSLVYHGGSDVDEDRQTVSLSDRGIENAQYLAQTRYPKAHFATIDDNDTHRLRAFRREHGRDPRNGTGGESGIVIKYRSGG